MRWMPAISEHFNHSAGQSGPALVMFDLDGTLIDSVPDLAAAVDRMLLQLERPLAGTEKVSHWVGNGSEMLVRRALADGNELQAMALPATEVEPARALFNEAYLGALDHATGVFAGVQTLLDELLAKSVQVALVTNKPRLFTVPLLQSLGWQDTFAVVMCGDDLAEKKPSPAPLLHVCEQLAIKPANSLMVGDSRHDIRAAQAAGIATVAVTYGYNHGEDIALSNPDWVVSRLDQLLA
ncbi:phosphoglycolate phosphatase [Parathalassolituus penaei]